MPSGAPSPGSGSGSAPGGTGGRKKAYAPPRVISREPLEAMAATCTGARAKNVGFCSRTKS